MVEARCLEERLIRMQRGGGGYFWIGGPGKRRSTPRSACSSTRARGLEHDYLHLHYRSSATLLAMGADPIDALRQMKSVATDPYSGGRNFVGHYAVRVERRADHLADRVQYPIALGTAIAQRHGGKGHHDRPGRRRRRRRRRLRERCLVWASRPAMELPMLIIVTNNGWASARRATAARRGGRLRSRQALRHEDDDRRRQRRRSELPRARASDALRAHGRKPLVLEAYVSRLYGHSSSSGSNYVEAEVDCVTELEAKLVARGLRSEADCKAASASRNACSTPRAW